ncbi:unnamed protein product [Knipowitschia caucasica]
MLQYTPSRLLELNNHRYQLDTGILKHLGILRRPRYVHRGSGRWLKRQKSSGNTVPAVWSVTRFVAARTRHQNAVTMETTSAAPALQWTRRKQNPGVDFTVLRPLPRMARLQNTKVELFNVQSLSNKACLIYDHIVEKDIDIMCLTETWQKPDVFSALNESCPPGYAYAERARTTGRGGGLAILHHSALKLTPIPLPNLTTFECLGLKGKYPLPITILLIYRPPKKHPDFIKEIHDFLATICTSSSNVLILGDLNIHVDTPSDHFAAEFLDLLDCLSLQQHVDVPSHSKGHILDLVITDSVPISKPHVYDIGVSDHKVISIDLPPHNLCKPQHSLTFRNLKNINQTDLNLDITNLVSNAPNTSIDDSVNHYNTALQNLLNIHAPVKSRTVTFTKSAPWFTNELRQLKTAGRALERCAVKNNLTVHNLAYRDHQKRYSRALTTARSQYYSNAINNNPGNSKQLFSIVNKLINPKTKVCNNQSEHECNKFMEHFTSKTDKIRTSLSASGNLTRGCAVADSGGVFSQFTNATEREVEGTVRKMRPSSCPLDPFPTPLIKSNASALSPLITAIINQSLQSGHIPPTLKTAIIRPHLKKPSLDPDILAHYRPISNLPFLSKVMEKVVSAQLQDHLKHNNLYKKFQSGFRSHHSTETALVRVTNDLMLASDQGFPSLLLLLDLTAAFDTIEHSILLHRLHTIIGLSGTTLRWFGSYLTDRAEYVALGESKSQTHTVSCGVPQGSVLGPTLFNIYMLPLGHVIGRHGMSFHSYADDTQLYVRLDPASPSSTPAALTSCLEEIEAWMSQNFLQLNSTKTEALQIGTPHQLRSLSVNCINFSGHTITPSFCVTNLGVRFDSHLTFHPHIQHISKTAYFHLRNIAKLRPSLSLCDAEKLVHAFVSSRLDYCNALLVGIPGRSLQKLQHIQNSAARVLTRTRKFEHITPVLRKLHWLPIHLRIEYKICLLTHQCIHSNAPEYLQDLLTLQSTSRPLRSTNTHRLSQPITRLHSMGDRTFSAASPRLWNALPQDLRAPQSVECFKKHLKTELFRKAYC